MRRLAFTNARLLDALAADFVAHRFDIRGLERNILNSRAYQRSSKPTDGCKRILLCRAKLWDKLWTNAK